MATRREQRCPFTKLTRRQAMALCLAATGDGDRNDRLVRTAPAFRDGCWVPGGEARSSATGIYRSLVARGLLRWHRGYEPTDEGFEALGRCTFISDKMRAALMARHDARRRRKR